MRQRIPAGIDAAPAGSGSHPRAADEGPGKGRTATGRQVAVLLGALALVRVFLTSPLPSSFLHQRVDDSLYVRLADALAQGRWLGPYDSTTLIKGIGYPLFLAVATQLGIPRRLAEDGLLIVACLALVWVLRRLGVGWLGAATAYTFCLFSPATFTWASNRIIREGIYGSQTLIVLSLAGALLVAMPWRRRLAIAGLLGCILSWYWQTREEGVWILPSLGLIALGVLILETRRYGRLWPALALSTALVLIPAMIVWGGGFLLRWQNKRVYGVAVDLELKDPDFLAAIGSLSRIEPDRWRRFEPLDRDLREKLYRESPTFRSLQPAIESDVYRNPHQMEEGGEQKRAFFLWTLRLAAEKAGHHGSAPEAKAFYRRLAREINALCDRGIIKAGPRRDTLRPRFHPSLYREVARYSWRNLQDLWEFRHRGRATPGLPLVEVPAHVATRIRRVVREPARPSLAHFMTRTRMLRKLTSLHRAVLPWLYASGAVALVFQIFTLRRQGLRPLFVLQAALLAAVAARALLVALIQTYSWQTHNIYMLAVYGLLPAAATISLAEALRFLPRYRHLIPTIVIRSLTPGVVVGLILLLGGSLFCWTWHDAAQHGPRVVPGPHRQVDFGSWQVVVLNTGCRLKESDDGLLIVTERSRSVIHFHIVARSLRAPADLIVEGSFENPEDSHGWQVSWHEPGTSTDELRTVPLVASSPGPGSWRFPVPRRRLKRLLLVGPPKIGSRFQLRVLKAVPASHRE